MFNVAADAPTLAGATTTAAFNLGNTAGPWVGGATIDAGFGYTSPAWAGAAITVVAGVLTTVSLRLRLHLHRRGASASSRVVTGATAAAAAAEAVAVAADEKMGRPTN